MAGRWYPRAGHSDGHWTDLKAAAGSTVADPALQGYFSIAYGQAARLAAPPAELPNLHDLIRAERSQLATTPAGLTQLAWRGTSLSLIGIQKMAIADLDIVISRLGDGIVDFGDGVFYAFQGLAYFLDGQWGRASISFDLARAGQSKYLAPLTSTMLPLAALITGDAERTREALEEARRIRIQSPQPAAVNAGDLIEVFALAFLGTAIEREQWLDRRIADFGDPTTKEGPPGPMISFVAQSIAATWAARPDAARDWAHKLRTTPLAPWTDRAAQWLEARTERRRQLRQTRRTTCTRRTSRNTDPRRAHQPGTRTTQHRSNPTRGPRPRRTSPRQLRRRPTPDSPIRIRRHNEWRCADRCESPVLAPLSDREREIATLLLEGLSYAQIGRELFITRSTVSFHLTRIYAKTGTTSRHELAQATHDRMS